jgi:tRNA-specific 2-thiouridylase
MAKVATRVVLAMSGGVDSSAAAYLLKEQGYDVIGLFMRSGATEEIADMVCATSGAASEAGNGQQAGLPVISHKSHKQGCCSASDAADARRVADSLDIPFHALNFKDAFGRIKDYFAEEYLSGRTPNPCVMCNNWLKFGKLWDFAQQVGAERIATGHYARLEVATAGRQEAGGRRQEADRRSRIDDRGSQDSLVQSEIRHPQSAIGTFPFPTSDFRPASSRPALLRGRDAAKDQSYVLFGIQPELLDRILFPLGDFTKLQIRELARCAGLRVADKPDSQEICFIPDNDYAGFLSRHSGEHDTAGELVDTAGRVLGRHDGYERFTIGQRKGLGMAFGAPRYVVAIEADSRRVVIGEKEDLARSELEADRLNWLVDDLPPQFHCRAQIRYQHTAASYRRGSRY